VTIPGTSFAFMNAAAPAANPPAAPPPGSFRMSFPNCRLTNSARCRNPSSNRATTAVQSPTGRVQSSSRVHVPQTAGQAPGMMPIAALYQGSTRYG